MDTVPRFATSIWCRWHPRCGPPRRANLEFPGALSGAVHGQSPDAADQRSPAVAGRPRRLVVATCGRCARAGGATSGSTAPVRAVRRVTRGTAVESSAGGRSISTMWCSPATATRRSPCWPMPRTEREILGAMRYQTNDTVLHTDAGCCRAAARPGRHGMRWIPRDPGASLHGQLLHESAAAASIRPSRLSSPSIELRRSIRARSCTAHAVSPSDLQPRFGGRAGAQARNPGPAPHLVRRRLLGLGIP